MSKQIQIDLLKSDGKLDGNRVTANWSYRHGALTDTAIRNTKPADKPLKLTDERGLYLLLKPNDSRWWRFDYRYGGKRTLSMGVYPDVSLKEARNRRDEARKLLASDVDPGENRNNVCRMTRACSQ